MPIVTTVQRTLQFVGGLVVAAAAIGTLIATLSSDPSVPTLLLLGLWVAGLGYLSVGLLVRALRSPEDHVEREA